MGGVAHISLDIARYPEISSDIMGRLIFTLTEDERAALERVRVKLGARSFADTIRALVARADELDQAFKAYAAETPRILLGAAPARESTEAYAPSQPDPVKGQALGVPLAGTF